jgi:integrase
VHLIPTLGRVRLTDLQPQHLRALYADRLAKGLSATTVGHIHAVLHSALKGAERDGLVPRNVAALVSRPRVVRREMKTLSPDETRAFVQAASGDRLEAFYIVAVTTGMRLGELLALRWRDLELDASRLSVCATLQRTGQGFEFAETKTPQSRRRVALGSTAVAALRRHRAVQNAERLAAGPAWQDHDLVFANEVGGPLDGSNLQRRSFLPLLKRVALPRIRFHDLRHTAATLLLGRGVHPKVVSEMLGHSQIGVTLDLYSHVTPTMQRDATAAVDAILTGP